MSEMDCLMLCAVRQVNGHSRVDQDAVCVFSVQVLRTAELPDCAFAYVQACREAGLLIPQVQSSSMQGNDDIFDQQQPEPALELFDILGLRTRMLLQSSNRAANSTGEASSGPELLQLIESEYHQYLCGLVANL